MHIFQKIIITLSIFGLLISEVNDGVVLISDYNRDIHTLLKPTGLPTIILLNDKLEVVVYANRGFNKAFDRLIDIYKK